MNINVVLAVFKRNFLNYFASPIGYVFICVYVLLCAFAAFWPNEFFNANLANLNQLNAFLPWIMLVFIPAITMSIWADERRQGTDELLLTLPAQDLDIVIGKYLAAVAIYTVALVFSASNVVVLELLGNPDHGLLIANYIGYWMVGAGMIAVGMVASFFTTNLTVAFILAILLNAPLVFAAWADTFIPWETAARFVKSWSIANQFADFSRGIVSISSIAFFVCSIVVMLYVAMVLIGRRHWSGEYRGLKLHYIVRVVCLVAIAVGVNAAAQRHDVRIDTSEEQLSSLSPKSKALLEQIDPEQPVLIDAYISPVVPESYVQTRLNLITVLDEFSSIAGDSISVSIHHTDEYSQAATEAREEYGIVSRPVQTLKNGRFTLEPVYLGFAVRSGLQKVVVPFVDNGIPIEYELVRSIVTVSQQERKKIGVLMTDANLFRGIDFETFEGREDHPIIVELRKQYEVVQVNPTREIDPNFDVLLAVQPSSLTEKQIVNFLDVVRAGVPVAIFEDPFPHPSGAVPGTVQPRPRRGNPFQQQTQRPEKGDITPLFEMLDVHFSGDLCVWQDYKPSPGMNTDREFIFVSTGSDATEPLNPEDEITSQLRQVACWFAGAVSPRDGTTLTFEPLLRIGGTTGYVQIADFVQRTFLGQISIKPDRMQYKTDSDFVIAARITGDLAGSSDSEDKAAGQSRINAVFVTDMDMLHPSFFAMRAVGTDPNTMAWRLDNVTFVLNVLDSLAGDNRFIDIRSRRPEHRTLATVEDRIQDARSNAFDDMELVRKAFTERVGEEESKMQQRVQELQTRQDMDQQTLLLELRMIQAQGQQRIDQLSERFARERDQDIEKIETELAQKVRQTQDQFKLAAIGLPPIPPLLIAIIVFFRRKSLEKVGVPSARLR